MRAALQPSFEPARQRLGDRWLLLLMLCLLGYALAGRGFAYLGVPPLFIGEACLLAGLLVWMLTRGWSRILQIGPAIMFFPLAAWGLFILARNIGEYQLDAVRDAVIWGYGGFAIVVAALIVANPLRLPRMIEAYRVFTKIFLIGIPIAFVLYRYARTALPAWPWANTAIIQVKEADALVHLGGILAFWMSDTSLINPRRPRGKSGWFWSALLTLDIAMMGVIDRSGLVAFAAAMIICVIARPRHGAFWRTTAMILCGAVLLWASQVNIEVPGGKGRNISWEQFVVSAKSIFGDSDRSAMEGNKEWRLNWWKKIIDYTVHGEYFWTGKGFGVNLADDDGFQVNADKSLRSPHSIHMSFLARTGVPGLALWAMMHVVWFYTIADTYLRARRRGQLRWCGLMLFLFAYYTAFLINGSFDVYLEGPMGGIWFWTVFGVGVGAVWCWRYCPQILADNEDDASRLTGGGSYGEFDESSGRAQLLPAAGRRGPGLPLGAGAARSARA